LRLITAVVASHLEIAAQQGHGSPEILLQDRQPLLDHVGILLSFESGENCSHDNADYGNVNEQFHQGNSSFAGHKFETESPHI
jgi:hypothetical protein